MIEQKIKLKWEDIDSADGDYHRRARIPGGWLYKCVSEASTSGEWGHEWRSSICFVPLMECERDE